MLVNVGPIRRQSGGSLPVQIRVDHPDELVEQVPFVPGVPLVVEGTVTNTGKGYLVDCVIRAELELECARCLRRYTWPLEINLCERYLAEDEGNAHAPVDEESVDDDDAPLETHTFRGDHLDLTEAVRDHVVVSIPMKPVCRDDCKGICSQCGKDLSEGECECSDEPVDIRLAPLAEWLKAAQQMQGEE